ncbi:MAG: hypothetical protein GY774_35505 [Planctomycetes bacterium]|nr:hypothetical protein [Planctomycetota bacterium]
MAQWTIYGTYTASKVVGVIEAETKEDAIEIAWADDGVSNESHVNLCHACASEIELGDVYEYDAEEA